MRHRLDYNETNKQTPWLLYGKRTIPKSDTADIWIRSKYHLSAYKETKSASEIYRPTTAAVRRISVPNLQMSGGQHGGTPLQLISGLIQVVPHLSSRG
jgi:hypothetical protein